MTKTSWAIVVCCLAASAWASTGAAVARPDNATRLSVVDFGARGDCVTDDAPALRRAIAARSGGTLLMPDPAGGCYLIDSSLGAIPNNTRLQGDNKATTRILRGFSGGYMMSLGDGASLDKLWIDGNGGQMTGASVEFLGADGNQSVTDVRIINSRGPAVHFSATSTSQAGSRANFSNVEAWQTGGVFGSGRYAFVTDDVLSTPAPRSFSHVETGGYASFDFGGSQDNYISNSTLFDLKFSVNSRNIDITASRVATTTPITLLGSGNLVASDVYPLITLGRGAAWTVGPGLLNSGYVDESRADNSLVNVATQQTYAPVVTFGGKRLVVGAGGFVHGYWKRHGDLIKVEVMINLGGARLVVPEGALSISLPQSVVNTQFQGLGSGRLFSGRGNPVWVNGYTVSGRGLTLESSAGIVAQGAPVTFGQGGSLYVSLIYGI